MSLYLLVRLVRHPKEPITIVQFESVQPFRIERYIA